MASRLERLKTYAEVTAIIAAGLFAFLTWGIDYISLSDPNWDLVLSPDYQIPAVTVAGTNRLCPSDPSCYEKATGCVFGATLKVVNKGKRPITAGKTKVDVYFIERFKLTDTVNNNSPYEYLKRTCAFDNLKKECLIPNKTFFVNEIDAQPIYPDNEGFRPFSIEINPNIADQSKPISYFTDNYVLLIVITQEITTKRYVFWNHNIQSKLTYLNQSICNMRNYKK